MITTKKKPIIDLPLKITLTEEGISWFIKHNKKLNRFRMANNIMEYGLSLNDFYALSLQKMLIIDYISMIEIKRTEFSSMRREIMDLSKLITYSILYKKFDEDVFKKFISSHLIQKWNRINPSSFIDENSKFNETMLKRIMAGKEKLILEISQEIIDPIIDEIKNDTSLTSEEKQIRIFQGKKFLTNLRQIIWIMLSRSKGIEEYFLILSEIRSVLKNYLEKTQIAEYLSLMIMELAVNAENARLHQIAKDIYHDPANIDSLILNKEIRDKLLLKMEEQRDFLYLTWKIIGKNVSIGTENRLNIILFDREYDYRKLKQEIDDKKGIDLKEKSLFDFYKEIPEQKINTELGLYYLSYLNEACEKQNIHFDTNVSQILQNDLTVITLYLRF